jgi:hypothetical protein
MVAEKLRTVYQIPLAVVLLGLLITALPGLAFKCGGSSDSFGLTLRLLLASAGPVIDALPLGKQKDLVVDFTDIGADTSVLVEELKAATDAPGKLAAVKKYDAGVEFVLSRGHFGASAKLTRIESLIRGIIASAEIFYGGAPSRPQVASGKPQTKAEAKAAIDANLKALKYEMDHPAEN